MRKKLLAVALVLAGLAVPAAGAAGRPVSLVLDWTPNPDHVGFCYAQTHGLFAQAGLDVAIHAPSDPSSPLKLVAAGHRRPRPLLRAGTLLRSRQEAARDRCRRRRTASTQLNHGHRALHPQCRRKTIGITGVPSDYAALDTALQSAGLTRKEVKVVTVGYNLLPALLAHRVDAVLGVYRNVEGIELQQRGLRPTIIPLDHAGVPTYDELVLAANSTRLRTDPTYAATVKNFVNAFLLGTTRARRDLRGSLTLLRTATASSARFLARATPTTFALLAGPHGVGCMNTREWQRFGTWMQQRRLLNASISAAAVMTTRYLPARCK